MGSQSSYDHGTPSPARILDNILKVLKDSKYQSTKVKQYREESTVIYYLLGSATERTVNLPSCALYSPESTYLFYFSTGLTLCSISLPLLKAGHTLLYHKSHICLDQRPIVQYTFLIVVIYVFHTCYMKRQCFLTENQDVSLTWVAATLRRNWP